MIKDPWKLTQLRRLSLSDVAPENTLHLPASLAKLNGCLRSLKIEVEPKQGVQHLLACLESVSTPPLQLEKLAPYGNLKKLPSWFASLKDHVAKITFRHAGLEDDAIEILQNLPHLTHLKPKDNSYAGEHLCFGRQGFPSLRILHLGKSKSMKSVRFEEGAMPDLRRLTINFHKVGLMIGESRDSEKVEFHGIEHLPRLKYLDLPGVAIVLADAPRLDGKKYLGGMPLGLVLSAALKTMATRDPGLLRDLENPTTSD